MKASPEAFAIYVLEQAWGFRKNDGDVLPTWFVIDDKMGAKIIGTPFDETVPDVKHRAAEVVAEYITPHTASVMFVADAWMRQLSESYTNLADLPEEERRPVREQVDAVEAIILHVWNRDRTGFTMTRSYRQKDDGSLEILKEIKSDGVGETENFAP